VVVPVSRGAQQAVREGLKPRDGICRKWACSTGVYVLVLGGKAEMEHCEGYRGVLVEAEDASDVRQSMGRK